MCLSLFFVSCRQKSTKTSGHCNLIATSLVLLPGCILVSPPAHFHHAVKHILGQRRHATAYQNIKIRSEERRVGKECRTQLEPAHYIKNTITVTLVIRNRGSQ